MSNVIDDEINTSKIEYVEEINKNKLEYKHLLLNSINSISAYTQLINLQFKKNEKDIDMNVIKIYMKEIKISVNELENIINNKKENDHEEN